MTGIILCGGLSTRMGSDKGLLQTDAAQWARLAAEKLKSLGLPVQLSINMAQNDNYAQQLPDLQRITDNAALPVKGPLLGLLSAHVTCPSEDLFILACDMPLITPHLLKELHQRYLQRTATVYLFENAGEPEPLCGIYTAAALEQVITLMREGRLTKFSMKFILDQLQVAALPVEASQKKYFQNCNAHADLNGL